MTDLELERVRAATFGRIFGDEPEVVRVGRYEIVARIGSGGMSVVYEARDPLLERRVAIKVVSSLLADPERRAEYQQRLLREGAALASVTHPNVVSVFDVGSADAGAFLALELVDGESLHAWLASAPRSWSEVLDVMMFAAEGLAAAHAAGLVHRDVTPRNIVVDRRGTVRVVDFGLVDASAEEAGIAVGLTSLTRTGAVVGTPLYMAPEQWLGAALDDRTDQFGFCATLFEALYGRPPFGGDRLETLERAITTGAIEAVEVASVPRWLHRAVLRGLAVDPAARHGSMRALIDHIEARRTSLRQSDGAEIELGRLRALLGAASPDASEIDRVGVELRSQLDAALGAWAENERARGLRADALALLIEHEVGRGNTDAAARLLGELADPPAELVERVAHAQARVVANETRLRKLERIERAVDVNVENEAKFRLVMSTAVVQALCFLVFGYVTRADIYAVGSLEMGLFYAAYLLPQLGAEVVARRVMHANAANRRMSQFGAVAVTAHAAMFFVAHGLGVPLATAFVLTYVMSTSVWTLVAVAIDRRASILPPITIASAIATAVWPGLCFEIHAAAAALGIGGVAVAMRSRRADPHGLLDG